MQLKYKIPLILLTVYVMLVGSYVAFIISNSYKVNRGSQLETAKSTARSHSNKVSSFMSERMAELKGLENNILAMSNLSDKSKLESIEKLLKELIERSMISNVYALFDRSAYFGAEATEPGHYYGIDCFRSKKGSIEISNDPSESVESDDDWYHVPKQTGKLYLMEPYKWKYPGETEEREMITLSRPIFIDGKFTGVIGMDIELSTFQKELFDGMKNEAIGAYAAMLSNNGIIAVHPKQEMLFTSIENYTPEGDRQKLKESISKGEYHFVFRPEKNGDNTLMSYVPMQPKGLEAPWSIGYFVPHSALRGEELRIRRMVLGFFVFSVTLWGIFLIRMMSGVFGNLTRMVKTLGKMTEGGGDLTVRLAEGGKDEIGQMSKGLNSLVDKLHTTIKTTQKEAKSLLDTSSTLYTLSHQLSKSSQTALEQSASISKATATASTNAEAIASGADRTSAGANDLASTAEQVSMNMNSVAGAVEEMSASFAQIMGSANESRDIAGEATKKSSDATEAMSKLGAAAKEIGHVTEVIKRIADKTNLLALNATIEAASAGAAGKGFAVVAGEIKELASQSASSADDIARRIDGIQKGTSNAVNVISDVSSIISQINVSIDSIAGSVGQQTSASNEIASNAEQANLGARSVVKSISEIAQTARASAKNADNVAGGAKDISKSVNHMHEEAKNSSENSAKLESAANTIKSMAENLDSIVSGFRT